MISCSLCSCNETENQMCKHHIKARLSFKLTKHKGHRDETGVIVAINRQFFKISLLVFIEEKSERETEIIKRDEWLMCQQLFPTAGLSDSPVSDADGRIHGKERQKFFVQQLVNASFPGQKQLGEAAESGICNSCRVGDSHWWRPEQIFKIKELYARNHPLCYVSSTPAIGANVLIWQVQVTQRPWMYGQTTLWCKVPSH